MCQYYISLYGPKDIFLKSEEYFENICFPNGRNMSIKTYLFSKEQVVSCIAWAMKSDTSEQWDLTPV